MKENRNGRYASRLLSVIKPIFAAARYDLLMPHPAPPDARLTWYLVPSLLPAGTLSVEVTKSAIALTVTF